MPLEETLDIRYLLLIYKKTQIYVPPIYTLRAFVKKLLVYFCWHYFCKIPLSYPNFLNSLSTFNLGYRFRFRFMDLFEKFGLQIARLSIPKANVKLNIQIC